MMTSERPFVARTAELATRLDLIGKKTPGRSCVVNLLRVQWLGVFESKENEWILFFL